MSKRSTWTALVAWLAASYAAAVIGGLATARSVATWYPTLAKPEWTPPPWLFGPVWSVLYFMMGVSAWLVWRKAGWSEGALPLGVFVFQLILNAAWSILFFGMQNPLAGLLDIAVLWVAIGATFVLFARVSKGAALLIAPYWLWVSFAMALNYAIWKLNR